MESLSFWERASLDGLAEMQRVKPVARVEELAADIWESPEELEAFLADVYAARTVGRDRRGTGFSALVEGSPFDAAG
jgi:uncharacterized protein (DUF2384 family)